MLNRQDLIAIIYTRTIFIMTHPNYYIAVNKERLAIYNHTLDLRFTAGGMPSREAVGMSNSSLFRLKFLNISVMH